MGGAYREEKDYPIPNIILPNEGNHPVGIWGQRHLIYLKRHRKVLYYNLLTSGKLNNRFTEIDKQAGYMFFRFVKEMAESEGVTEQLKAENSLERTGQMNNIRSCATERVNKEIIFA